MERNDIIAAFEYLLDASGADQMPLYEVEEVTDFGFIIRTKSGKEYTGTAYDARIYMDDKDDEDMPEYQNCVPLYRYNGQGMAFITNESIESIIIIDNSTEEKQEEI